EVNCTVTNAFSIEPTTLSFLNVCLSVRWIGVDIVVLLGIIIIGGVKRLGKATEYIVPFMAGAYILIALVIIALNVTEIPAVFKVIVFSAFSIVAIFCGIVVVAFACGLKRGGYCNEAVRGTAA